jgi:hypothetical protein
MLHVGDEGEFEAANTAVLAAVGIVVESATVEEEDLTFAAALC